MDLPPASAKAVEAPLVKLEPEKPDPIKHSESVEELLRAPTMKLGEGDGLADTPEVATTNTSTNNPKD